MTTSGEIRGKRDVSPDTRHTFSVSQFTFSVKVNIDVPAGTRVTITSPDLTQNVVIAEEDDFAVYQKRNPQPGDWLAVVDGERSSISVVLTLAIDATIVHLDYNQAYTISPIACKFEGYTS